MKFLLGFFYSVMVLYVAGVVLWLYEEFFISNDPEVRGNK